MLKDLSLPYLVSVPGGRDEAEPMPMVILIHGRGADAYDLVDLARLLDSEPGYRFVLPNAPKQFEPMPGQTFGWSWFDGWPPEASSVKTSRERLSIFITEALQKFATPAASVVLAGFSQGAMMALDAAIHRPADTAAVVVFSGGLYEHDLGDAARQCRFPVFIGHGLYDDVVPLHYAQRARQLLEGAGVAVDFHEYPMAHQIAEEELAAARAFIARAL